METRTDGTRTGMGTSKERERDRGGTLLKETMQMVKTLANMTNTCHKLANLHVA